MPTLSSLVVQRNIASLREVEEAISRQVLHGGDLVTNLLDMAPDREAQLSGVLAESLGMPQGPVGRLPPPDQGALEAVSAELALRHAIFPISFEGAALLCATSEPLAHEAVAELGASIGRPLRFVAAPFLRVREGIAAHYGIPLERRLVKLVAKLDGLRMPPGSSTRPPPVRRRAEPSIRVSEDVARIEEPRIVRNVETEAPPPSFPSVELGPASRGWPDDLPVPSVLARQPLDATDVPHGVRDVAPYSSRAEVEEDRPSGPPVTTRHELARWLHHVADSDRRARARPARRKGPMAVGEAEAVIDGARGAEAVLDGYFAFASQFFEYSALFGVRSDLAEGHDAWGPGTPRDAIVAIGVPLDMPSCFSRARDRKAPLLERIPEDGLDRELQGDLGRLRPSRGVALVLPVVVRGRTVALLYGDDGASDVDLAGLGPVLSLAHRAAAAIERLALERKRATTRRDALPASSSAPPSSGRSPPSDPRPSRVDRDKAAAALAGVLDPHPVSRMPAALPGPATDPYLGPPLDEPFDMPEDGRAAPRFRAPPDLDHLVTDEDPLGAPPALPTERAPRSSPLPPPSPSGRPPSVIPASYGVRRGPRAEHAALLARAARGGPDGEEAHRLLLAEARGGLGSLMAQFPGPLGVDRVRARQELAAASSCGVLLALLVELGRAALPFVTTRASSADVEQRFWATHLLAELPFIEAASAVVPRLFDEDLSVRRVARRSAARLLEHQLPDEPIAQALEDTARDEDEPTARRALAIETLGELRHEPLVAPLVRLLDPPHGPVPQVARRGLLVLTRQDFGTDGGAWAAWWSQNRQRHRVEWLIDALTHEQPGLRRAAADELKHVTQEYFGYYDDLPPRERERAQARYREWWVREGQLRFY